MAQVIGGLATDPRPPGFRSLTGRRPYPRVRSGDYRVIDAVGDRARIVTLVRFVNGSAGPPTHSVVAAVGLATTAPPR